jgi:hypothetical protein
MIRWRHTTLFLSLVAGFLAQAQFVQAEEENPPLILRNDISDAIDLYIASEKSTSDSPWHHFHLDAGQSTKVNVIAPDRYFVVLQIGNERSRSKPLELRKFVAAHPNYVMRVSEIADMTVGAGPGGMASQKPPEIGVTVLPDPSGPTPSDYASLPVQFQRYDANDQSIWSISADSVTLKLHNDLDNTVNFYIASKKSDRPNPWTELQIEPNSDSSIILKSPDPFMIRIEVGNESARSKPVELKSFLANHRDYVLNVGRSYETMMAGGPMGGGGEEEKPAPLKATVVPDQKSGTPTQPEVNPDPMQNLGGGAQSGSSPATELRFEWEN